MAHHPNSELVAVALLRLVPEIVTAGIGVATELPGEPVGWVGGAFVQVSSVGGSPDRYVPIARPVLQVDCYAAAANSTRSPWGRANGVAEYIRSAMYGGMLMPVRLTMPSGAYNRADAIGAWMLTEPRRVLDDAADFARFTFDMQIDWVEVAA